LNINDFCSKMRRKLVSFEHHIVVKEKIDIYENKSAKEWFQIMVKWIKFYSKQ